MVDNIGVELQGKSAPPDSQKPSSQEGSENSFLYIPSKENTNGLEARIAQSGGNFKDLVNLVTQSYLLNKKDGIKGIRDNEGKMDFPMAIENAVENESFTDGYINYCETMVAKTMGLVTACRKSGIKQYEEEYLKASRHWEQLKKQIEKEPVGFKKERLVIEEAIKKAAGLSSIRQ